MESLALPGSPFSSKAVCGVSSLAQHAAYFCYFALLVGPLWKQLTKQGFIWVVELPDDLSTNNPDSEEIKALMEIKDVYTNLHRSYVVEYKTSS